jgi:hypothetical protein
MHDDDKKWVISMISKIPKPLHKEMAVDGYKRVYNETFNLCPVEHQKSNLARRTSNIRLREFVDKCLIENEHA